MVAGFLGCMLNIFMLFVKYCIQTYNLKEYYEIFESSKKLLQLGANNKFCSK